MSSANSAASSLPATSSVVAGSRSAITNSSANSAPPIASSAASEHTRLFGYRTRLFGYMSEAVVPVPEVEPEVDQTLAPRTISTSEASPGTYLFVCLAYSNQTHPPAPSERVGFALINLREKRIEFPLDGNEAQVHKPSSAHFHPWQAATSFSGISTAAERSC